MNTAPTFPDGGISKPSVSNSAGTFNLKANIVKEKMKLLWSEIRSTFRTPSSRQKDAYGRFCMAMSGACFVGAVTLGFSAPPSTTYMAAKVFALVFWGVVLFVVGSILSKGE